MNYLTVREAAQKWNVSQRLVQRYCAQGRIDGAKKLGASWLIPAETAKLDDPRREKGGQASETPEASPAFLPCPRAPGGTSRWQSTAISVARRKRLSAKRSFI